MHEKEGLGPFPSEETLDLARKILKDEVWSERERFGRWKDTKQLREIEENEIWNRAKRIYRSLVILDR